MPRRPRPSRGWILFAAVGLTVAACSSATKPGPQPAPGPEPARRYTYRVVNSYRHDPDAWTQGLAIDDSVFYESTGLNGASSLRRVNVTTGVPDTVIPLLVSQFGEGLTMFGDSLLQITWQTHVGFVHDRARLGRAREVTYPTEGWGVTWDGSRFVMSDGTSTLYFRDPVTFEETGRVTVYADSQPVARLNELEYVDGLVYANIWMTDLIAQIDPTTGRVVGWIDLAGLKDPVDVRRGADVLNGIAWDPAGRRLFVTGKLWSKMFEIVLVPR
jgi:glutamine cyclotransferase